MEEQFVLRVPPSLAAKLHQMLEESGGGGGEGEGEGEQELDLSFEGDGRSGSFRLGSESFPAHLLDLPCIVESWKTYDDNAFVKTADIGQMILVRPPSENPPEGPEYKHGLTPPMRDVRRRRFRRKPDLNPEIVEGVERDLQSIMAGGTAKDVDMVVEVLEHEEEAEEEEEGVGTKEGGGEREREEKRKEKKVTSGKGKKVVKKKKTVKKKGAEKQEEEENEEEEW